MARRETAWISGSLSARLATGRGQVRFACMRSSSAKPMITALSARGHYFCRVDCRARRRGEESQRLPPRLSGCMLARHRRFILQNLGLTGRRASEHLCSTRARRFTYDTSEARPETSLPQRGYFATPLTPSQQWRSPLSTVFLRAYSRQGQGDALPAPPRC